MKKIKAGTAIVLLSVLAGVLGYKFIYILSPRTFIGENVTLAYVNEDISNKDFKSLEKITEGTVAESAIKELENVKKYIKGIYIFTETQIFEKQKEYLGVIDTGFWYPFLLKDIENYFEKTDFFYVLKDEYKKKYTGGKNIYMIPYRGQFIISLQPELIKNFDGKEYVRNKEIGELLDKERKNGIGILFYNGKREKSIDIDAVYLTGNIEEEKLKLYLWHKSTKDNPGYAEKGKVNRVLSKYLNPNVLYISMGETEGMDEIIAKGFELGNTEKTFVSLFQGVLGFKLSELEREFGGEILLDLKKSEVCFSLKEAEKLKKAFKYLGKDNIIKLGDKQLILEENYITYGMQKLEKGNIERTFFPHNFLYLKLDFEELEKESLDKGTIEINGYAEKRYVHLYADADNHAIKSLINYIEKEVKND